VEVYFSLAVKANIWNVHRIDHGTASNHGCASLSSAWTGKSISHHIWLKEVMVLADSEALVVVLTQHLNSVQVILLLRRFVDFHRGSQTLRLSHLVSCHFVDRPLRFGRANWHLPFDEVILLRRQVVHTLRLLLNLTLLLLNGVAVVAQRVNVGVCWTCTLLGHLV